MPRAGPAKAMGGDLGAGGCHGVPATGQTSTVLGDVTTLRRISALAWVCYSVASPRAPAPRPSPLGCPVLPLRRPWTAIMGMEAVRGSRNSRVALYSLSRRS